jgi:HAD superfamily hydrolase (TIGR01490 family)
VGSAAAYFDIDGTLVGTTLIHPTVLFLANQASPMRSLSRVGRALLGAPKLVAAELRDRRLFNELLFYNYKGMTEDRIEVLAGEIYEDMVRPRIFKGAPDLVKKCRDAGQRVVFITGSLDVTIRPLAEELGADHIITNRLEYKDGVATGRLRRPVVAGPNKAGLIVDDARENGHELDLCSGFSDSYSDVPMLSVVGHPACINPDSRLRRLAAAYSWPILDIDRPSRGVNARTSARNSR